MVTLHGKVGDGKGEIESIVKAALGEPESVLGHEWIKFTTNAALWLRRQHPEWRNTISANMAAGELARLVVERGSDRTFDELKGIALEVLTLDDETAAMSEREGLTGEDLI